MGGMWVTRRMRVMEGKGGKGTVRGEGKGREVKRRIRVDGRKGEDRER